MKTALFLFILSTNVLAQGTLNSGYLRPEDQKYYQNDQMEGMNKQERLDSLVKEVNKMHAEIEALKVEVAKLKEAMANKK
jgi:hypothetical protein